MDSRKSHSWWWNSPTGSKNSKWLSENAEEMDRLVSEMLKLIEEDGDSFAIKAEMYYQKRPVLISYVKEFYRMYHALAQRCDHTNGDLATNTPTEIQSGISSEFGIEAELSSLSSSPPRTPEAKVNHFKPQWRAAGFAFFLGSGRSVDRSKMGSDESSSESGSESDHSKIVDVYENSTRLENRIISLENELREATDKLHEFRTGSKEQRERFPNSKKLDSSLTSATEILPILANENFLALEKQIESFQADLPDHKAEFINLMEKMDAIAKQFENEISRRDSIITDYRSWLGAILNRSMQDDTSFETEALTSIAEREQIADERSRLEIKILEQNQLIMDLKFMSAQSSKRLRQDKYAMEAKLSSFMVSSNSFGAKFQISEKKVKQLEAEKSKACAQSARQIAELTHNLDKLKSKLATITLEKDEFEARVSKLVLDIKVREEHMEELIEECKEARKVSEQLTYRVSELVTEVARQRELILDGAEGKREAIRQLCFYIEHYRTRYQQLCKRM